MGHSRRLLLVETPVSSGRAMGVQRANSTRPSKKALRELSPEEKFKHHVSRPIVHQEMMCTACLGLLLEMC